MSPTYTERLTESLRRCNRATAQIKEKAEQIPWITNLILKVGVALR